MKSIVYTCTMCPTTRTPSNHWLVARKMAGGGTYFIPWNVIEDHEDEFDEHLCGAVCAHKLLDRDLPTLQGITK